MRNIALATIVLFLLTFCNAESAQVRSGVSIQLSTNRVAIREGEALHLLATLYNKSSLPVSIEGNSSYSGEEDYYLKIIDQVGRQGNLTEFGEKLYRSDDLFENGVRRVTTVAPGQSLWEEISSEKIYNLLGNNTYFIEAVRKIKTNSGTEYVSSNIVTVFVGR